MNRARLLKLATHLEHGTLIHRAFDYREFNSFREVGDSTKPKRNAPPGCGTAGCALGECPAVWPRLWRFDLDGFEPRTKGFTNVWTAAETFFDLTSGEASFLFLAGCGNNLLPGTATRKQVARHIRKFVENRGIYDV